MKASLKRQRMVNNLLQRDGDKCAWCGGVLKQWEVGNRRITIDHITPTSKGGINDITNKRLLHYHCNQQRGNSDIMSLKELSA